MEDNVSNYRPVSLLPITGKISEKIVHGHITDFFEKFHSVCKFQGGIWKNHSKLVSLSKCTTDTFNTINNKKTTIATFFVLKTAFDTVNHKNIIKKLYAMGIKGGLLDWVQTYLNTRFQNTICNNN